MGGGGFKNLKRSYVVHSRAVTDIVIFDVSFGDGLSSLTTKETF